MSKKLLILLGMPILAGAAFGITSLASAQTATTAVAPVSQTAEVEKADGAETSASETADSAVLQTRATITADQARASASASMAGTIGAVQLEDENGVVVYNVTVGTSEVKVDAGTGKIVASQQDDANEKADSAETPESR